ncbi:hypothetical protein D9758_004416 [Tetrapyrgos nigripes]|uniref:F-box domain-containing protein n=1 Tax=Tetrapyrgos nigripes TaxID=182062 RepID=A0A8H5LSU2_9AGAR|nr:hypothetical protein D9758_004416 [Tetrapyrgos nigripes]
MSRRSTRLEEKRRTTGVDPYEVIIQQLGYEENLDGEPKLYESDSVSSDDEIFRRPKKRSKQSNEDQGAKGTKDKSASQRIRGRRGILQKVKEMPLDILFETFSYLEPLDILHLARTSHDLRDLLMSRSSSSVWRNARRNIVGIPPLPFDMDEPQYANLAFDSYCHICMQPRCENILWQFRTRCCRNCITTSLVSVSDLVGVWRTTYARTFSVFELVKDYVPYMSVTPWQGPWGGEDRVYYPPVVKRFRREFKAIEKDQEKLDAWVKEKREQYKGLMEHVEQCSSWSKSRHEERKAEFEEVRRRRKEQIVKKLSDIGWAGELQHIPDLVFSQHKLVHQAKELTEKGWKSISGPLLAYLAEHKESRLDNQQITQTSPVPE